MPPSHQRHRRSPFKRTSFRRTSSGSSSLRSFSEVQSRSDTHVQASFANPEISGWEKDDVVIRNGETDTCSVSFRPAVTVTLCRDEVAVVRKVDGGISQSRNRSHVLRCENEGGVEGRDISLSASSMYSINTLGYATAEPGKDVDNGSYMSCSSIPTVPELSLEMSTSTPTLRSEVSALGLNAVGKSGGGVGISMVYSRMERWKSFGKARGFLGGRRVGDEGGEGEEGQGERGGGNESRNENENGNGKEKREKKIRPFLRKYCLHPFSMRSSFRLVGWIEDPIGSCVGHDTAYGTGYATGYGEVRTGYAYGGGIGDARLWDEARRSGWEGGLY
ncbi:uncharacterized protein EAE98_011275 [Botrytis deweyae]|uniref:Uncharacterized protein n=1 Tax=Botrytis deweyae TaxID=2478750 RepID=A0ABQ7I6C2_9HELO|nr:uncharacterized protein EAE98_011275 [Botrytis deweyae]KAF7915190.1 hypothetical protein EAE98_011275 [Botrytis deweyae]